MSLHDADASPQVLPNPEPDAPPVDEGGFGAKAEAFARFFGTPKFLTGQTVFVIGWLALNGSQIVPFDKFPFILLNLAFSLQAAYAAPLILLAQTRQADRDRAETAKEEAHREQMTLRGLEIESMVQEGVGNLTQMVAELRRGNADLKAMLTGGVRSQTAPTAPDSATTARVTQDGLVAEINRSMASQNLPDSAGPSDSGFGAKAEAFARFFGTPKFLIGQTVVVGAWLALNGAGVLHIDKFPFILLNLGFTVQAAYAAPLILLAQTRQALRSKARGDREEAHREQAAQRTLQIEAMVQEGVGNLTREVSQLTKEKDELIAMVRDHVQSRPETTPEPAVAAEAAQLEAPTAVRSTRRVVSAQTQRTLVSRKKRPARRRVISVPAQARTAGGRPVPPDRSVGGL